MAASLPSPVSPSARRHGLILILLTVFAWSVIGLISKTVWPPVSARSKRPSGVPPSAPPVSSPTRH